MKLWPHQSAILERECVAVCSPAQSQASVLIQHGNVQLRKQVARTREIVKHFQTSLPHPLENMPPAGTQVFVDLGVDDGEVFADWMLLEHGLILASASNYVGAVTSQFRIPTSYPEAHTKRALGLLLKGLTEYLSVHVRTHAIRAEQ